MSPKHPQPPSSPPAKPMPQKGMMGNNGLAIGPDMRRIFKEIEPRAIIRRIKNQHRVIAVQRYVVEFKEYQPRIRIPCPLPRAKVSRMTGDIKILTHSAVRIEIHFPVTGLVIILMNPLATVSALLFDHIPVADDGLGCCHKKGTVSSSRSAGRASPCTGKPPPCPEWPWAKIAPRHDSELAIFFRYRNPSVYDGCTFADQKKLFAR